jgi:FimV-like protein
MFFSVFFLFPLGSPSALLAGANEPLISGDTIYKFPQIEAGYRDEASAANCEIQKKDDSYADLYTQILDKNKQILTLRDRLRFYEPVSYSADNPVSFDTSPHSFMGPAQKFLNQYIVFNADINYWALAFFGLVLCLLFKVSISRTKLTRNSLAEMKISTPTYSGDTTRGNEHEAGLDFAKALVELGEIDRARKILEIVKAGGTPEQVAEVDNIVKSLSKE